MAVIPGTRYAEGAPSGKTGQVLMPAPERDNSQQIASAVGQLGGAIMDYALSVQKKKMVAETSQKQREIDEAGWAASEAVTGDAESDKKVWEKFQQDSQRIAGSSEYKDVNSLLQEHLNSVTPNWRHAFDMKSLGIQEQEASDQLQLEYSKMLEYGDMAGAKKIADNALRLKAITQAQYDNMTKRAPGDSHLLRAERMIANEDYGGAISELDKTAGMDLTTEQLQDKQKLKLTAERSKDEVSKVLINDVMGKVAGGMPLTEVSDLIQQTVGLTPEQKTELMKIALNTEDVWQKTGKNPFTTTQNYPQLVNDMFAVNDGKIKTHEQLRASWLKDGTPAYSMNEFQELDKKIGGGDDRLREQHPLVQFYLDSIDTKLKKEKMSSDEAAYYVKTRLHMENYARNNLDKPNGSDIVQKEYDRIMKPVKEKQAKRFLSNLLDISQFNIAVPIAKTIAGARGKKPQSGRIKVKSPDGKTGNIPESQWEEAQKAGYMRVE